MIIIMKLCRALPQYPSQPYFCLPWLSFLRIPRSLVLARHFFSTLSIASDSSRTSFSFPFFPPLHKRSFRSTARFPRRMRGCLLRKNRAQRNQTPKCARAFYLGTNLGPWMHTSRWKNFSFSLSLSVLLSLPLSFALRSKLLWWEPRNERRRSLRLRPEIAKDERFCF